MKAYCLIRDQPVYRREAFVRGLRAVGYEVVGPHHPPVATPGDVLVIWNRYGQWHESAVAFDRAGGSVLVAENAYVANDRRDRRRYALARDGHNGSGWWSVGGPERWQSLGLELKPWRDTGGHVLIAPNRPFGMPGFAMSAEWAQRVHQKLTKLTDRPLRIRVHPGNDPPHRPFAADLEGAHVVVIWSSSVGCESLLAGVPVICCAPWWICKGATTGDLRDVEHPMMDDARRLQAFERLAWAQWTIEEIENGEPFQHLLIDAPAFAGCV